MLHLASSVCGLFKWRQFEPEVILLAVGWYLRFSLSYREVEELLAERGLHADHVTVWRWVQRYAPEMERRLRSRLKPTNGSWRVDETYIRVKGKWRYLYRAVDSSGATLDFLLSAKQDAAAAKRFLAKALGRQNHPVPRVINTDKHAAYPPAIVQLKDEGVLEENCQHRPVQYLNNVLEQDHRAIKRRINASQHFRSFCFGGDLVVHDSAQPQPIHSLALASKLSNRHMAVRAGGESRRSIVKAGFGTPVGLEGPTIVSLLQVVAHRFAGLLRIGRCQRRHDFTVFAQNCGPGFCVIKMDRKLPSPRSLALVKQSRDQPQENLVLELRRDVQVKLPIGGQAGWRCRFTFHRKENLFECGNVLLLHAPGGFLRDCPLNEDSNLQDFERSLVTRTVRRPAVWCRDNYP